MMTGASEPLYYIVVVWRMVEQERRFMSVEPGVEALALIFTYNLVANFVQCSYHRCKPTMEMHDDAEYR